MKHDRTLAGLVGSGRIQEALELLDQAARSYRRKNDMMRLGETLHQQAALLLQRSPETALGLCAEAEGLFQNLHQPLMLIGARITAGQALLALGKWQPAALTLKKCRVEIEGLDLDTQTALTTCLRIAHVLAEASYLGYQQGANNLQELYLNLLDLAKQLEQMRRMSPVGFDTVWLFGELDLYERIVAVAYQLGLVTQAADWAERTKSRRLLDLLLNLPFDQEKNDG